MNNSFFKKITLNRVKFTIICLIPLFGLLFCDWDKQEYILFIFFEYSLFTIIIFLEMIAIFFFTKDIRFITVLAFLFFCIIACMVSFTPAVLIGSLTFPLELISGKDRSLWTEFITTQKIFILITIVGYSANFIRRFIFKNWHIKMKSEYSGVIERIINMVLPFGIYFVFHLIVTPVSFLLAKSEEAAVEVHTVVLLLIYVISRLIFEWKNDKKLSYYYEDN